MRNILKSEEETYHVGRNLFERDSLFSSERQIFSLRNVRLYNLENSEGRFKMIIKGRSLMVRLVSRTRVAFDWLRLNQNTLTEVNRDEMDHLLYMFTMVNNSFNSRSHSIFELTSTQPFQCDTCRRDTRKKPPTAWLQSRDLLEIPSHLQSRLRSYDRLQQRTKHSVYSVTMHVHVRALVWHALKLETRCLAILAKAAFSCFFFFRSRQFLSPSFLASRKGGGGGSNGYRCTCKL